MAEMLSWTGECPDRSFPHRISPDPDALLSCIQCGSCTASCPTASRMGLSPRQLARLIQLGLKDEVLASKAFVKR